MITEEINILKNRLKDLELRQSKAKRAMSVTKALIITLLVIIIIYHLSGYTLYKVVSSLTATAVEVAFILVYEIIVMKIYKSNKDRLSYIESEIDRIKKQLSDSNLHQENTNVILDVRKEPVMKAETEREELFKRPYPNNILPPKPEDTEEYRKEQEEYTKAWLEEEGPVSGSWFNGSNYSYSEEPVATKKSNDDYMTPEEELEAEGEDFDEVMLAEHLFFDNLD